MKFILQFMSKVMEVKKASAWLKNHKELFNADINEPWLAHTADSELIQFIGRQIESETTMDDLKDNFMFNFNDKVDLNVFQQQLMLQENVSVNCCFLGLDYLKDNVIPK